MQITVKLFAGLRERANTDSITVDLPDDADGATVQDAIDAASSTVDGGLQIRGHIMLALKHLRDRLETYQAA